MYAVVFHAHQKIDRVARKHLAELAPAVYFPSVRRITHFEGIHGPDSAKLKRQSTVEQPWHFIDPQDETDVKLELQIRAHYKELVKNLKQKDEIRSAFEAAWLAHALVDGLTPAHHYPYEEKLEELRGEQRGTRKGIAGRAFIRGENMGQSVAKSLKLIGPKGLLTTHAMFEAGAFVIIAPLKLSNAKPSPVDIARMNSDGMIKEFKDSIRQVAAFNLYVRFYSTGWTRSLSQDIKQQLAPRMVKMVTLAWYCAAMEANKGQA
jgi:hypothetical protein